jgi:3-hydroxyacyl-CoA dehydrogenase
MAPGGGVRIDWHGNRAVLTLESGPSNALTAAVRSDLLAALTAVTGCDGIVLLGARASFSSALPLEPDPGTPTLAQVCRAVETGGIPVVAALHGLVMGSGAELALAASARVAVPGTRLALPYVALGLSPDGGTTRRLPRLVGAELALDLMISGRAIGLDEGLASGLIDARVETTLVEAALEYLEVAKTPRPIDPANWAAAVAKARRGHANALPAVGRIIDCVEAALLLPPDAAQAFETVAREDLEASSEAQGLRSAARAERRAAALPQALTQAPAATQIGLSGQSPALVALAEAALSNGLDVIWQAASDTERGVITTALETALAARQRRGQLTAAGRAGVMTKVQMLERLPEGMELRIVTAPPEQTDSGTLLVLDGAPGKLGLAVAPSGRASELALPAEHGVAGVAVAVATLRRIGLPPLLVSGTPGLGARVVQAGDAALRWMLRDGVPLRNLTAALEGFGVQAPILTTATRPVPREVVADEVLRRWLGAQANEGLRLVESGIARRPSDIDHALVAGHSFPRWRGGPMHQADRRGLLVLRHDLRLWARDDAIWQPAPLLDRLIGRGLRLSALDG